MDGTSAKKSTSFETLVIQNISNVNDMKAKLNEIISAGKDYEYDVSSCLKSLLKSGDRDIVRLTVEAVAEVAKCEEKRETYAHKDVIEPLLAIIRKDFSIDTTDLIKHCCRALGNLCCDCDTARQIILDSDGIPTLVTLLRKTLDEKSAAFDEVKMFSSKVLLNFAIGGQVFSESIAQSGLIQLLHKILVSELEKDYMSDDVVSTALLILSVINDNSPELLFEPESNIAVLNVLKETTNVEISELCLDHLHTQAEDDTVKTLLANEKGVQLVCRRLEHLVRQHDAGEINTEDAEVEAVMKQACDLIIIVLTGDEAMHSLYEKGHGEVYLTMVNWLQSTNHHLLTTAVLAIGNFARQDDYCIQMMNDKIFDKLLDIFEFYHNQQQNQKKSSKSDCTNTIKIQHAVLSAIRNLTVPVANKKEAAKQGRAAPILLSALPSVEDHHVAYKMLAAIRMLVDGQEEVAILVARNEPALRAVAGWGGAAPGGGAAAEAPRLLAWGCKLLARSDHWRPILQVEGCISSLVNMLVACHSIMQNEAILALTLLAVEALKAEPDTKCDYEKSLISQLIKAEIGKHISVLIETNCAKMPEEVAENLITFLLFTSQNHKIASDYKEAKVNESLQKFMDSRKELSDELKGYIMKVITTISKAS